MGKNLFQRYAGAGNAAAVSEGVGNENNILSVFLEQCGS